MRTEAERKRIIAAEKPIEQTWDGMTLAEVFAKVFDDRHLYCPERSRWYTYRDGRWTEEAQKYPSALMVSIKEFKYLMNDYANTDCRGHAQEDSFRKFCSKLGDRHVRENLAKDAADALTIHAERFDSNPSLINCLNGTFDLSTGEFRRHDSHDYITYQTRFALAIFGNTKGRSRFQAFIEEVCSKEEDTQDYLQKALGYSLLGRCPEECMFILYGKTTRNGKSTLLESITHALGDYARSAPVDLICRQDHKRSAEAPTAVLASLQGIRIVTMAESEAAGRLDESLLKQYTGGESVTARQLYKSPVTFRPQFTMWLSCNDLPEVKDPSVFASDRIRVIEFKRHFTEEEQDHTLKALFETNEAMSEIFWWMYEGLKKYQKEGLAMTENQKKATRSYQRENDHVLEWLEERCRKYDRGRTPVAQAYDNYSEWCQSNRYAPEGIRIFSSNVLKHPEWCEDKTKSHGVTTFSGFYILDEM